jgi:large subunit ribosomal protein L30
MVKSTNDTTESEKKTKAKPVAEKSVKVEAASTIVQSEPVTKQNDKVTKPQAKAKSAQAMIKIKQVGSALRRDGRQVLYLKSLGLGKMNRERLVVDNLSTRGLLSKLRHMVVVVEN